MRKAEAEGGAEADLLEHLQNAALAIVHAVDGERLAQGLIDGLARMQRAERVLKHHLYFLVQGAFSSTCQSFALVGDRSPPSGVQSGECSKDSRFTRSALADQPEGLAGRDLEADIADGIDPVRALAEADVELLHANQGQGYRASLPITLSGWPRVAALGRQAISPRV